MIIVLATLTDQMLIFSDRHLRSILAEDEAHSDGTQPVAAANSAHRSPAPTRPRRAHQRIRAGWIEALVKDWGRILAPHRPAGGPPPDWNKSRTDVQGARVPGRDSGGRHPSPGLVKPDGGDEPGRPAAVFKTGERPGLVRGFVSTPGLSIERESRVTSPLCPSWIPRPAGTASDARPPTRQVSGRPHFARRSGVGNTQERPHPRIGPGRGRPQTWPAPAGPSSRSRVHRVGCRARAGA